MILEYTTKLGLLLDIDIVIIETSAQYCEVYPMQLPIVKPHMVQALHVSSVSPGWCCLD